MHHTDVSVNYFLHGYARTDATDACTSISLSMQSSVLHAILRGGRKKRKEKKIAERSDEISDEEDDAR